MPKICYKDYNPKGPTLTVIQQADEILREYAQQGYQLSVRQLYYVFISRDLFPETWIDEVYNARQGLDSQTKNTMKNYNRLKDICTKARDGGFLDWDHLTDRGRELESLPHWRNPEAFLDSVCPQFKIDLWLNQPKRVEVWVEKDALSQVIERACVPFDVPFFACKGYASASSVWEAARKRFLLKYHRAGQSTTILQLSDHDPSGVDMTRDLRDRLYLYGFPTENDGFNTRPRIRVKRLALTMEQIEQYEPPPNPAKETDPRSVGYKAEYGDRSWELDALMSAGPNVLVDLIQNAIREETPDLDLFAERQQLQRSARSQLERISEEYEDVMAHLGMEHLDCDDEPDPEE